MLVFSKGKRVQRSHRAREIAERNPIVATATGFAKKKAKQMPPDVTIEVPEDVEISMELCEKTDPNVGKLILKSEFFTINLKYRASTCAPVSSM